MLYIPTVFASRCLEPFWDHVFLFVFEGTFLLVVEFGNLSEFADFVDALLIHDEFGFFLYFFEFFLHSNFLSDFSLHDFFGDAGVNGHESLFFLHELFFGDGRFLEVVFFLVFSEPLGKVIVVFESKATIRVLDNLLFGRISEHFFGNS